MYVKWIAAGAKFNATFKRHACAMSHSDDASRQGPLPVYIDGLVILKIIKHVQDEGSEFVNGDLVGLDVTRRLIKSFPDLYPDTKPVPSEPLRVEVTNCVPELPYAEEDVLLDFRQTMVSNFREAIGGPSHFGCGIDHKTVGWYTTSSAYASDHFIERQYKYQCDNSNSVMLIYEAAVAAASGCVSVRVVRLTDMFMELYKNGARSFTKEELDKRPRFSDAEIFEEVPFFIHNCAPIQALLQAWSQDQTLDLHYDTGRLDLNSDMFLERYLESASDAIFDLGKVSSTYERTRAMVQRNRLAAMQEVENKKRAQGLPQVSCILLLPPHLPLVSQLFPAHQRRRHPGAEAAVSRPQQTGAALDCLPSRAVRSPCFRCPLHLYVDVSTSLCADGCASGIALALLATRRSPFTSCSQLPLYPILTSPMNKGDAVIDIKLQMALNAFFAQIESLADNAMYTLQLKKQSKKKGGAGTSLFSQTRRERPQGKGRDGSISTAAALPGAPAPNCRRGGAQTSSSQQSRNWLQCVSCRGGAPNGLCEWKREREWQVRAM